MDHEGMCAKCSHRKACKTPCAFVEALLKESNKTPFYEVNAKGAEDQPIKVIKSKAWRYEINETNLDQYKGGAPADDSDPREQIDPFTTLAENPFADLKPTLSQTAVFINRFFLGQSYEDIAAGLGVSGDTVASMFRHAQERLLEALKFIDSRQATIKSYQTLLRRNEASFGKLPKGQKWFLMNQIIGLTIPEIADLEGTPANQVNHRIKETSDRLKTGAIAWLNCSDEDRAAAQARLDKKRHRDRKQWRKAA